MTYQPRCFFSIDLCVLMMIVFVHGQQMAHSLVVGTSFTHGERVIHWQQMPCLGYTNHRFLPHKPPTFFCKPPTFFGGRRDMDKGSDNIFVWFCKTIMHYELRIILTPTKSSNAEKYTDTTRIIHGYDTDNFL